MTRKPEARPVLIVTLSALIVLSLVAISPVAAFTIKPYTIPDRCVVQTDEISVFPPLLRLYKCRFEDNKIQVEIFKVMMTAPPGIYRNITRGVECRAGKDGVILSCRQM